jgi:hypothetical protein
MPRGDGSLGAKLATMAAFCVGASLLGSALLVQPPVRLARVRATRASARMLDEGATEKVHDRHPERPISSPATPTAGPLPTRRRRTRCCTRWA